MMSDMFRVAPDPAKAMYAVSAASIMLETAIDCFQHEDYMRAYDEARNSIRMAGMALLHKDGFVSDDFNSVAAHLRQNYKNLLPLEEWEWMESTSPSQGYLYKILLKAMGKVERSGENEARTAIQVAGRFVEMANSEIHR